MTAGHAHVGCEKGDLTSRGGRDCWSRRASRSCPPAPPRTCAPPPPPPGSLPGPAAATARPLLSARRHAPNHARPPARPPTIQPTRSRSSSSSAIVARTLGWLSAEGRGRLCGPAADAVGLVGHGVGHGKLALAAALIPVRSLPETAPQRRRPAPPPPPTPPPPPPPPPPRFSKPLTGAVSGGQR